MNESKRNLLRSKTVGARKEFQKEIIEWEGLEFEIRQPTVAIRSKVMSKAGIDITGVSSGREDFSGDSWAQMQAWLCIECVYDPESGEKVFEEADLESLKNQPAGSFVDRFASIAMGLMQGQVAQVKNSEETSKDETS